MSAPQRHLSLINRINNTSPPSIAIRPSMVDRFSQMLHEIEVFLLACTYEEMCNFWNAIANLRQYFQKISYPSEMPQFLNIRRKKRDYCRILEVLADLPYPQLHLSHYSAQPMRRSYAK